ncbi:ABC transporter substrate-binding protein [Actinomadura viridis]|uniref:ABC transporter substrate-binding protein n=1 Tax=Actinomadura viridis TaxID=58110 RepID=UPI00369EC2CD
MNTGHGGPPSAERLEGLLSLFERIRERPRSRAGDRLRPLLLTIGSPAETRQVSHVLVERCMADPGPHSHITSDVQAGAAPFTDLALLLRHVSRELSSHHPRFEPGLRFPMLSMVLWLLELRRMRLEQEQSGNGERPARQFTSNAQRRLWQLAGELDDAEEDRERRTLLGRGIRSRRQIVVPAERPGQQGRLASVLSYLEQVAPIGVALVALVSATAASTLDIAAAMLAGGVGLSFVLGQVAARTRDWAGRRRYRWFASAEQPYMRGNRSSDFLGFALDVFYREETDPGTPLDDELERLLIAAFLQDLRQAYRRGIGRAPWARVRYPVVVIDQMPEDHPGRGQSRRFVERVEELRRREERFDPLVMAVATGSRTEARELALAIRAPLAEQTVADLGEVREQDEGHPFWAGFLAEQRRVAVLGTRRELRVDAGRGDGSSTEPVYRGRRRPVAAHPALPWLVAGTILAGSLSVISFQAVRYCAPFAVWHAENGECIGISNGSYEFNERLAGIQDRIKRSNDAVVASGKKYVTMVYLGPMTVDPDIRNPEADLLAGIHGELVGLSIAQRRHNEASGQPRLRILLANSGSRFRHARQVAERIRERAAQDGTIVAVVGFGQSREQTGHAIEELSRSALPMIGTTNTYDGTAQSRGRFSPYYFRLAPPNRTLARHAAFWGRNGQTGIRADSADVFYDTGKGDLYSRNLAADFAAAFAPGKVRMLPYSDPSQVPGRVLEACTSPADLFYYAGRSDEFRSFINRLANTDCKGRRVVLAGDEVTKYVSDNARDIGATDSIRLFFSPLAAKEAWEPDFVGDQPRQIFYPSFDQVVEELVDGNAAAQARPSRTHAALGYDAARTVISAAERIYGDQDRTLPTAAAILSELTEPGEGAMPQGATGLLRFGPRSQGHQIPRKPVLLTTVRPDGSLRMVAVCGELVREGRGTTGACPTG